MKDVRSYLNTVSSRISKAFSIEDFETEQELEFWALSAEHMSRKKHPSFSDIVHWVDLLYSAPVHIVYKKDDDEDQLTLFKRQINSWNLLKKGNKESKDFSYTEEERQKVNEFEQTVQNLQFKREWYPEFMEHGVSSHSIGNCEHIPIYKNDGDLWGIYVVGPQTKCPEIMVPKLSIVGRLLSIWLIAIEEEEKQTSNEYQKKMEAIVSDLGSGALNTKGLTSFYLRFLINNSSAKGGAVIEAQDVTPVGISAESLSDSHRSRISSQEFLQTLGGGGGALSDEVIGNYVYYPFNGKVRKGYILLTGSDKEEDTDLLSLIAPQIGGLYDFEKVNEGFTEELINSYYNMLRRIERKREKTRFHTPRMLSFIERFSMLFGLDEGETAIIMKAAKLHDIGYVGGLSVDNDQSISKEMMHPLTGYKLIDQLPLHDHVKEGILSHHEWVNGQGSPMGFEGHEIAWTGKILSVFEFIVEFIESNAGDTSKSDDEWMETLTQSIIERADKQFDMVLVPTVIQLLQSMGWEICCMLGTE